MHDLQRLLAHDVRAEDAMRLLRDDELARTLRPIVDDGAIEIGVGHRGDDASSCARACSSVRPTLPYSGSVKPPCGTIWSRW